MNKTSNLVSINNQLSNTELNQSNKLVFNIVIPNSNNFLNFLNDNYDPNNIDSLIFDLTKTYNYNIVNKNKKFNIEMTHLLFEINNNMSYCLSALYCYDPILQYNHRESIKDILNNYYQTEIKNKKNDDPLYNEYKKILNIINSIDFWKKKMYFRIGKLLFTSMRKGTILYINELKAWHMKKGSGALLICILLKMNLSNEIMSVSLESGSDALENKYYIKKLHFKKYSDVRNLFANVSSLIESSCVTNLPKINLILKNNNEYISNFEEFKEIFISKW